MDGVKLPRPLCGLKDKFEKGGALTMNEALVKNVNDFLLIKLVISELADKFGSVKDNAEALSRAVKSNLDIPEKLCWM